MCEQRRYLLPIYNGTKPLVFQKRAFGHKINLSAMTGTEVPSSLLWLQRDVTCIIEESVMKLSSFSLGEEMSIVLKLTLVIIKRDTKCQAIATDLQAKRTGLS